MVTNKNVHGKLFFWNTLHHKQHYTWQPRSANVTHESASLQNQIQVTDARFFLNLHGLLVKHCVNLCPHQQSYLIIFSMTWQLSQSLTWEARRRKKSEGREHGMWACQCIGLGVPAEPWDAEISLSGLYWERSEWAHQYSLTCSG